MNAKEVVLRHASHAVLAAAVEGCAGYRAPATALRAEEAADEQCRRCVPAVWQQGAVPAAGIYRLYIWIMVRLDTSIMIIHTKPSMTLASFR